MDILTNIIAAEEDELDAVAASSRPLAEWSGVERHGHRHAHDRRAALPAYRRGARPGAGPLRAGMRRRGGRHRAAPGRRSCGRRLAALDDEDIEPIAEELAAIEEFELEGWDAGAAHDWLVELADLARLAEAQEQAIFIWMQRSMG
jgi:hypothetical protein